MQLIEGMARMSKLVNPKNKGTCFLLCVSVSVDGEKEGGPAVCMWTLCEFWWLYAEVVTGYGSSQWLPVQSVGLEPSVCMCPKYMLSLTAG